MIKLKNAQGILSTEVPTGNLVWVDQVNGNDKLAARGRLTIPFRTLNAAKNAARGAAGGVEGDTIVVLPGEYNEYNLLKDGVNWHFMNGAKVSVEEGVIFDTGAAGTNGAVHTRITGWGYFFSEDAILSSTIGNSTIHLEAEQLISNNGSCVHVAVGDVFVRVTQAIQTNGGTDPAVWIEGGLCTVHGETIHSSGPPCIDISGGTLHVTARVIEASTDHAIQMSGGTATVQAFQITSYASYALYHSASQGYLTVAGARITSALSAAVWFEHAGSSTERIRLMNCVLIAGGTYSIDAVDSGPHIQCVNTSAAKDANTSYVTVVGYLLVASPIT